MMELMDTCIYIDIMDTMDFMDIHGYDGFFNKVSLNTFDTNFPHGRKKSKEFPSVVFHKNF